MTDELTLAAAEDAIHERWPNKGPCLVPHKSAATKDSMLLSCHENDFCLCDMRESYALGARWAFESEAVRALIEDLKLIQSMNGRNDGCSYCAKIAHKALSNWNEMRGEK